MVLPRVDFFADGFILPASRSRSKVECARFISLETRTGGIDSVSLHIMIICLSVSNVSFSFLSWRVSRYHLLHSVSCSSFFDPNSIPV